MAARAQRFGIEFILPIGLAFRLFLPTDHARPGGCAPSARYRLLKME